jgi:hypothetical protein
VNRKEFRIYIRYLFLYYISILRYTRSSYANCLYYILECSFKYNDPNKYPLISILRTIDEDSDNGTIFTEASDRGYFRARESRLFPRPSIYGPNRSKEV